MTFEEIIDHLDELEKFDVESPDNRQALREAIAKLRTHPDAQPNEPQGGGWISTEDKPQDGEGVLVYTAWHETMTTLKAVYINGAWWRSPGMCRLPSIPTHWRPMPEPPKEGH